MVADGVKLSVNIKWMALAESTSWVNKKGVTFIFTITLAGQFYQFLRLHFRIPFKPPWSLVASISILEVQIILIPFDLDQPNLAE